jgi:hypothetical protein
MNAYQRQLPLCDLMLIAQDELRSNPTISTYTFENGVERRRYIQDNMLTAIRIATDNVLGMTCDVIGIDFDSIRDFTPRYMLGAP